MSPAGLYRVKPGAQERLRPLEDALVARGVSADALTAAAVLVAVAGGACLALGQQVPLLFLAVPLLAGIRLVANLLDGQVARRTGTSRPMGEIWNETGDRVADVLFIGGLAFVPAVGPWLALSAAIAAVLASYVGITAKAAGAPRQYGGVMSKPGRMIVLAVAAPLAFFSADDGWLVLAAAVILVGSLLTLVGRLRASSRALDTAVV
jgi:phosphatidylglycerophosphate synthase